MVPNSVRNLILIILNQIVRPGAEVEERVTNNLKHVVGCILFIDGWIESSGQLLDGLSAEAGKSSVEHQRDQCDDLLVIGAHRQIGVHTQHFEPQEWLCIEPAAHHLDHFIGELDVGLKAQIATGRTLKHEAEILKGETRSYESFVHCA